MRVKGSWYIVQEFTNKNIYDISLGPLSEDNDCESSDSDVYQEDGSSNNCTSA